MTFRRLIPALLFALTCAAQAQTVTGSLVSDPAVPTIISPATNGNYYVLNKDLSLSGRYYPAGVTCPAPAGLSASSATPRTLLNDGTSAYATAQSSSASAAATTYSPGTPCSSAAPLVLAGGTPTQTFTTNNPRQGVYNVLQAFNGNGPDTLTVVANLNTNSSSTPTLTKKSSVTVDTGGTYTAMLTDINSSYGNTIITELRTATSPGGLFVYSPGIQTVFKILGPGGVPLPAIGAFIIPAAANDNGDLLVLVNQDNLTATNQANPPVVLNPFTIIDLGQLQRAFVAVLSQGTTVTLPAISQIPATTPYYAMLGAQYSPVFHLLYALVAGGTSSSSVTQSIIRYDPTNPLAPAETVVADVSNIPFTLGTYPQLALNAAAGTMEILSQGSLYHVTVAGKNNTALAVAGNSFGDNNFKPTYIAANPLLGETYIASSASVDIFSLSGSSTKRATIELYGVDNAIANQTYQLYANGINPDGDSALSSANITFTATPAGGSPIILATVPFSSFNSVAGSTNVTFPAAGIYTIVASAPATTNYPAFSSLPLTVGVGATGVAAVYPTGLRLIVPQTSSSTTVTANLYLTGSTYAPTGRIVVTDATGSEVGRFTFTGGATSYPVTATLTLPQGASTLTALYNGDSQNKTSTSPAATITVGTVTKVTPTMSLTLPSTASPGATINATLAFTSSSTSAPTGNITVTQNSTAGVSTVIATIPAAQAAVTGGKAFTFTAPTTADSYNLYASYDGDTNFNLAFSPTYKLTVASSVATTSTSLSGVTSQTSGTAFTVTVRLTNATSTSTPTGNISVTASPGNTVIGTVTAAQALAVGGYPLQVTFPNSGSYTITATYPGDTNFTTSSGSLLIAVKATIPRFEVQVPAGEVIGNKITGTLLTTLTGSPIRATGNYLVTATNISTGVVTPLASIAASLSTPQATASDVLTFQYSTPAPAGLYRVDASYAGDANYSAIASQPINFNALRGIVAFNGVDVPTNEPIGNTVTGTVFASYSGATNPPTGNIIVTATNTSTGVVTPLATIAGTSIVPAGSAVTALSFSYITPGPIGLYRVDATYASDTSFTGATAFVNFFAVAGTNTATSITLSYPGTYPPGASFTTTVTLVPQAKVATPPTGSITVTAVNAGGASFLLGTVTAANALNGANFVAGIVDPGPYTIKATYPGDALYSASTKTGSIVVAKSTPSLTLTGPTQAATGIAATYTVALTGYTLLPSNNIIVSSTATGSPGPTATVPASGGNGILTFTGPGTYTVTASIAPGPFSEAATAGLRVVVTGAAVAAFTLAFDDPASVAGTVNVPENQPVDIPFTFQAINGYQGSVSLTTGVTNPFADFAPNPAYYVVDEQGKRVDLTGFPFIPDSTPLHLKLHITGAVDLFQVENTVKRPTGIAFAGLFLCIGLLGWRRRKHLSPRLLSLLLTFTVIAASGAVLAGCGTGQRHATIFVDATGNGSAANQHISVNLQY